MKRRKNIFELNHSSTRSSTQQIIFNFEDFKTKKKAQGSLDLIYVVFPSGLDGYRLEIDGEDIGTIFYNPKAKQWRLVQW